MFKKIQFFALSIITAISISFNCFAFEISDLPKFKDVSTKVLTKTDTTIKSGRAREITGTKELETLFGEKTNEYTANYVYIADKKTENAGRAKWYFYYQDSWGDRGRGKLNYDKNEIMHAAEEGDLLVVGKRSDKEIDIVIIQQGHGAIAEVYDYMASKPANTQKPSIWARLLGSKESRMESVEDLTSYIIEANDIEIAPTPPDTDWTRIKVDMYKDNDTGKTIVSGVVSAFDDGDSFWMTPLLHFRLVGYDTPEDDQVCTNAKGKEYNCGEPSAEYMKQLVGKGAITCTYIARDAYKRLLVDCFNSKGKNLANEMVLGGHAIALKKEHRAAESAAKANKRGIWQGEFIKPKEHRDKQKASCEKNSDQDFCVKYGFKKKKK
jgi:endonuclease YncB( thermonuclease family)